MGVIPFVGHGSSITARRGRVDTTCKTSMHQRREQLPQWRNGIISRADVAEFLVRQIGEQAYIRKTPVRIN
jgi:hypothetical protein